MAGSGRVMPGGEREGRGEPRDVTASASALVMVFVTYKYTARN